MLTLPSVVSFKLTLAAVLLSSTLAGYGGWKLRDSDYQAHLKKDAQAERKAQEEARKLEGILEGTAQEVREEVSQAEQRTQIVYRTVIKEVPKYVTQTVFEERVVAGGGLPAGFVWLHNQSASNTEAPLPSGLDPDAPTGASMSDLASVLAGNYALCQSWRGEADGWRSWYARVKDQWPTTASTKETQ